MDCCAVCRRARKSIVGTANETRMIGSPATGWRAGSTRVSCSVAGSASETRMIGPSATGSNVEWTRVRS